MNYYKTNECYELKILIKINLLVTFIEYKKIVLIFQIKNKD